MSNRFSVGGAQWSGMEIFKKELEPKNPQTTEQLDAKAREKVSDAITNAIVGTASPDNLLESNSAIQNKAKITEWDEDIRKAFEKNVHPLMCAYTFYKGALQNSRNYIQFYEKDKIGYYFSLTILTQDNNKSAYNQLLRLEISEKLKEENNSMISFLEDIGIIIDSEFRQYVHPKANHNVGANTEKGKQLADDISSIFDAMKSRPKSSEKKKHAPYEWNPKFKFLKYTKGPNKTKGETSSEKKNEKKTEKKLEKEVITEDETVNEDEDENDNLKGVPKVGDYIIRGRRTMKVVRVTQEEDGRILIDMENKTGAKSAVRKTPENARAIVMSTETAFNS